MPRGDKSSYSSKQKRQAEHIEQGYEDRGISKGEAERRAWATVNKTTGGGKKSGSGRGHKTSKIASKERATDPPQSRGGGGHQSRNTFSLIQPAFRAPLSGNSCQGIPAA
jgi:plasmid stabilization system protein ParE